MAYPLGPLILSWLPSVGAAGYKVYAGRVSNTYTVAGYPIDVGNVTTTLVTLSDPGFWYFAITAYDAFAVQSGFSNEIVVQAESPLQPHRGNHKPIHRVRYR